MIGRKRRRGTGTIEPCAGGYRARLPCDGPRLDVCATYDEAASMLDGALATLRDQERVAPDGLTLAAFGESFLDAREQTHRNAGEDRSRWHLHIASAPFAGWPLRSIAPVDVRAWLDAMLRKKARPGHGQKKKTPRTLSRTRVQNTLNLLRTCLSAAVDRGLLVTNPAEGVRLPRSIGATHDPWTYLLADEQRALLGCEAIPLADRLLYAFLIGTGMRPGEAWNLELRDVDTSSGRITIRYGSKGKATKGGRIRRIPLLPLAAEALTAWLPILSARPNPASLVWPLPSGARRAKGKAPRGWRQHLLAAGLVAALRHDGREVRLYDLRHTCASSLIAGWMGRRWTLEEVKGLLGHRSITTTERYAHLSDGALEVAARETSGGRLELTPAQPQPDPGASGKYPEPLAPPARIGLATFGLGKLRQGQQDQEVARLRGVIVGLWGRAIEGLEAVARGGPDAYRVVAEVLGEVARAGMAEATAGQKRGSGRF